MEREPAPRDLQLHTVRTLKEDQEGWIYDDHLWSVGFQLSSLPLIEHLSGLVEVLDVIFDDCDDAVVLIVKSLDETGHLFVEGNLEGIPLYRYRPSGQRVKVEATRPFLPRDG